ncbi:MAG: hypothetical protein WCT45_00015 [Candidatus Paceibacterota bacterium]|jgi:hypothetical protein
MAQAMVAGLLTVLNTVLNQVQDTGRMLVIVMLVGVMARLMVMPPQNEKDEGFWRGMMVLTLGYVAYQTAYGSGHTPQAYFWVATVFLWGLVLADAFNKSLWVKRGKVPIPLFLILAVPQLGLAVATAHVVGLI